MPVVKYPNNKIIEVACSNKSGISTVIDVMTHPYFDKAAGRKGKAQLIRNSVWFKSRKFLPEGTNIDYSIAIIRDPVQRIASCYADRVLKKNRNGSNEAIPDWNYFVENLDKVRHQFKDIGKHSIPQSALLGISPREYDYVFNTRQLGNEFVKTFQKLTECTIPPSHSKSSGNIKSRFEITEKHRNLIKEYYQDDYLYWSEYF